MPTEKRRRLPVLSMLGLALATAGLSSETLRAEPAPPTPDWLQTALQVGPWLPELAQTPPPGALGGPQTGLEPHQLLEFVQGRAAFRDGPSEAQGLGPRYVQKACGVCHAHPLVGGEGDMDHALVLAAKPAENDVLIVQGHAIAGFSPQAVAAGTVTGRRRAPQLFGMGLIDAIPAEVIASHADPKDANKDGIKGRTNQRAGQIGRWGLKSHDLTMQRVVAGSLFLDLGLTHLQGEQMGTDEDSVPDPEASPELVRRYLAFVTRLAPPPRGPITDEVRQGEKLFQAAGCAACHLPDLGAVKGLYSDLLLHDMGQPGDDKLPDSEASGRDWRTAPLWGLRTRRAYLHDHRAKTLQEAIDLHLGEGQASRDEVRELPEADRQALLAFLRSL